MMGLLDLVLATLRRSLDLSGRASRAEFWVFTLLALAIMGMLRMAMAGAQGADGLVWVASAATALLWIPQTSVCVRRLHDTDHRGLWLWALGAVLFADVGLDVWGNLLEIQLWLTDAPVARAIVAMVKSGLAAAIVFFGRLVIYWYSLPSQAGENRYGAAQ